jgi:hypothetical protein
MNDLEGKPPVVSEADELKQRCDWLQRQMTTLLLALVIVSGTLTVFLWRQTRYARRDLESIKTAAAPIIQDYNRNRAGLEAFVTKLAEYGRAHPDFAPIMQKYGLNAITTAPPATAAPPKTAPAPAPASKK